MLSIQSEPVRYTGGRFIPAGGDLSGKTKTMAYSILQTHNTSGSMSA